LSTLRALLSTVSLKTININLVSSIYYVWPLIVLHSYSDEGRVDRHPLPLKKAPNLIPMISVNFKIN
jgi:hypothetical protein